VTLIAENPQGQMEAVGALDSHAINFTEITKDKFYTDQISGLRNG